MTGTESKKYVSIEVLIVDDEQRFLTTTAKLLSKRGICATITDNGHEAIEALCSNHFDVIILDQNMPGLSGLELLEELKKYGPVPPVIMLSGHGSPMTMIKGLQEGIFDFLCKPCSVEKLLSAIKNACLQQKTIAEQEKRVHDVLIPLSDLLSVPHHSTFGKVLHIIETHRTTHSEKDLFPILVHDSEKSIIGSINQFDLFTIMQPNFFEIMNDSPALTDLYYLDNPMNWSGFFTIMARERIKLRAKQFMSPAPPLVHCETNMMVALSKFASKKLSVLLVEKNHEIIGAVRSIDLLHEIYAAQNFE